MRSERRLAGDEPDALLEAKFLGIDFYFRGVPFDVVGQRDAYGPPSGKMHQSKNLRFRSGQIWRQADGYTRCVAIAAEAAIFDSVFLAARDGLERGIHLDQDRPSRPTTELIYLMDLLDHGVEFDIRQLGGLGTGYDFVAHVIFSTLSKILHNYRCEGPGDFRNLF
jgi:hypothetical protein